MPAQCQRPCAHVGRPSVDQLKRDATGKSAEARAKPCELKRLRGGAVENCFFRANFEKSVEVGGVNCLLPQRFRFAGARNDWSLVQNGSYGVLEFVSSLPGIEKQRTRGENGTAGAATARQVWKLVTFFPGIFDRILSIFFISFIRLAQLCEKYPDSHRVRHSRFHPFPITSFFTILVYGCSDG